MALTVENITFDSTDPDKLADWWARAVDGTVNPLAPGFFVAVTAPAGRAWRSRRSTIRHPGKNRVHIDFTAADMEAEVKRLVDLGATETGRGEVRPDFQWVVLADPDGNAFCVAGGERDAT